MAAARCTGAVASSLLAFCMGAAVPALAQQVPAGRTIFVAPGGNDEHPGTIERPLATIHAARDRIRQMKAEEGLPGGGVTVFLRGGEYVFDRIDQDMLRAGPGTGIYATGFKLEYEADSGTAEAPILYRAYPGEAVALTLAPSLDFRTHPIINQADHVTFEGIGVRGGVWDALHRPPMGEVRPAAGEPLRLVGDGRAFATVVIADEASETARYAAGELVHHVRRATGVELPVVAESEAPPPAKGRPRVFVGETRAAEAQGLHVAELPPEVHFLKTVDGDLYILGRESEAPPLHIGNPWVGTLHGLYAIVERSLGARWLWPGELGTYIPERSEVLVAPVDEVREPALRYRTWSNVRAEGPKAVYMRRHGAGTGTRPHVGHGFEQWRRVYAERHPEWFALDEAGERSGDTLCVSNPDLRRQVAERRSRPGDTPRIGAWAAGTIWDDHWNGGNQLTLGEADRTEWCRCAECMALDAPHPEDLDLRYVWMGRVLADRYADFIREVSERARRVNPGVRITNFLYWQTFHAPLGDVELGPDLHGEFVQWMGKTQWFPMPEDAFAHIREQWLGWKRTGISMAYRPNYFHGGYVLPFFSTRQAGEFLRFAREQGSIGWSGDSSFGHWSTQGPMLYLHMRMLNDPETTVDQARAEYFSGFGPAADAVERYFDYWEDFSHRVVAAHPWPRWGLEQMTRAPFIYTPEVFVPAAAILDEAKEAARNHPDGQYARRVEFIRLGLDHAAATMRFVALLDNGAVPLHDRARFEATQAAWREVRALRSARRDTAVPGTGIELAYDLHVGRYPVTHAQYHAFCEATGRAKPVHHQARGREDMGEHPITQNRWVDYVAYCNWLSEQAGLEPAYVRDAEARGGWRLRDVPERVGGYRMPLHSEWEYAAQGGAEAEAATRYAGSDVAGEVAWHGNTDGLQPVGRKRPNALGLHDMSGLVGEWVNEGYLLGGSYWYPADRAVVYPAATRTNWGGELHEGCGNQNWHSGLRVVRTAIGNGGETGERFPETVLVRAGSAIGQMTPFIDLAHIETRLEDRWLKGLDSLAQDFEAVREAPPPPSPWSAWRFRADPEDRGVGENWFAVETDAADWREIPVPAHWSATWNAGYLGHGWYRTAFRFPREWTGEPLRLSFGGVDEQAWVYVNGVFVGEHSVESEGMDVGRLWNRPFEIEVPPEAIRPGEVNTLMVRVHASRGDGGIHQRVDGAAPHPEDRRRLPAWEE